MSAEISPPTGLSDPESSVRDRISNGHLSAAILVASLLGWLGYSYPPVAWHVPDSMLHIGALSSASDQAKLAAVEKANLWKNTILKFTLAGLGIGLCGLVLHARALGHRWLTGLLTLVSGPLSGAMAGVIGLMIRQYLDRDYPIPLINDASRPLFADIVVFSVISAFLMAPIAVLLLCQPVKTDRHKAFAVLLAGVLTGLVVPLLGALMLSGYTNTSIFPPAGTGLTAIWFATMALITLVFVVFMGSKARPGEIKYPAAT